MVKSVLEEYLARLNAPKSLSYHISTLLRSVKVYNSTTSEMAGEPATLDDEEFARVLEERIEVDELSRELHDQSWIEGMVRARIFRERMLTSSQAGDLLGTNSKSNKRQYANNLRTSGELLGIPHKRNRYVYPAFQFDVKRSRLRPVVSKVNKLLDALHDPWGVASWWITPSERLDGKPPKELLGTAREKEVLELAEAELEPVG